MPEPPRPPPSVLPLPQANTLAPARPVVLTEAPTPEASRPRSVSLANWELSTVLEHNARPPTAAGTAMSAPHMSIHHVGTCHQHGLLAPRRHPVEDPDEQSGARQPADAKYPARGRSGQRWLRGGRRPTTQTGPARAFRSSATGGSASRTPGRRPRPRSLAEASPAARARPPGPTGEGLDGVPLVFAPETGRWRGRGNSCRELQVNGDLRRGPERVLEGLCDQNVLFHKCIERDDRLGSAL